MKRRIFRAALLCLVLAAHPAGAAAPEGASETDRLLFADRDWSGAAQGLIWSVEHVGPQAQGVRQMDSGKLILTDVVDPEDGKRMLQLRELGPGRDRIVGTYSPSVDPMLIYFLETTTRQMAAIAQGNPNYIRNRIKAALRDGGDVTVAPDGGRRVSISPFVDDRNAPRMGGFDKLTLVFTLAAEDHSPIRAFAAVAPQAGYRLNIERGTP